MIDGNVYLEIVESYFDFLQKDFGFKISEEKIRGNAFYDVQYRDTKKMISISYENIEDYFLVTVFILQAGRLPNYDDKSKTLHLNTLNNAVLPNLDQYVISQNNDYFSHFHPSTDLQRKILKSAKELRLCLIYFDW